MKLKLKLKLNLYLLLRELCTRRTEWLLTNHGKHIIYVATLERFVLRSLFSENTFKFPAVCSDEVGIGSWVIKDLAFTASSYLSSRSYPWMARLGGKKSWCPDKNDTQPFLQVSQLFGYVLCYLRVHICTV